MPEIVIKNIIKTLPNKPGVYQYYNDEGTILYVGKAKNIKKRVASYFTKNHENGKTANLVRQIADIKTIVVGSEIEALLLENNLIKKYQPKYNIMLKDDKTYPWIALKMSVSLEYILPEILLKMVLIILALMLRLG